MSELKELYAWVADGEDGFCAIQIDGAWFPLVFGRLSSAKRAEEFARVVWKESGHTLRLVRFERAEELKVVEP